MPKNPKNCEPLRRLMKWFFMQNARQNYQIVEYRCKKDDVARVANPDSVKIIRIRLLGLLAYGFGSTTRIELYKKMYLEF